MIRNIQVSLILFFITAQLYGQLSITGKVINIETGEFLPGANIKLENTFIATSSGPDGDFFINTKAGAYVLTVSYIGFKPFSKKIDLNGDLKLNITLEPLVYLSDEVIITAIRADAGKTTSQSRLNAGEIKRNNIGRDLPYFLETMPSTVITSDAGNGIGYTGIRIRGTDLTGINVTLNGVPVNDAESHAVFFVDLPDLASSIDNLNVNRGVGASSNGSASFGASINIKTGEFKPEPYAELSSAAGSFNTFKNTVKVGSGFIRDKWVVDGRFSWIKSDGYIDRASSDLRSVYLSGGYFGKKDVLKFVYLHGEEKTYQAWYGVPKDSLSTNRTYNPAGEIFDNDGNFLGYYDNQTDNYKQSYYQMHYAHEFNTSLNLSTTLFYTRGIGYYESYENDEPLFAYGQNDTVISNDTISTTDLIRQKWLDNHFYGINFSANYIQSRWQLNAGAGLNRYDGDHFGYVVWSQVARLNDFDRKWYDNTGIKTDYHVFAKATYNANENLNLYLDLQIRGINYSINGTHDDLTELTQDHNYFFFNPKLGLSYQLSAKHGLFAYAGVANREPNRSIFRDADPGQEVRYEQLIDYELGYKFGSRYFSLMANFFYMGYKDQFVLTGKINNVGTPIMTNVDNSYRTGLEVIINARFLRIFDWNINATFSQNRIKEFIAFVDNWDTWPIQEEEKIGTTTISFSPAITAVSNLTIEPVQNLEISLITNYVSRQYIDNTESKYRSIDPYLFNNILVNYSLKTSFIHQIDFLIALNNVFNSKYETNAWVYRYITEGQEFEINGYFPQAGFNFMAGIGLKF